MTRNTKRSRQESNRRPRAQKPNTTHSTDTDNMPPPTNVEPIEINRDEGGEVIVDSPPSKKSQGIQYKYWCFTWNNYHLNDQLKPLEPVETIETIDRFAQILQRECEWYIFQEEIGEQEGTPHLQGSICLKKKQRLTELRKLEPRIRWFDTKAVRASVAYCSKQHTKKPNGGQWIYNIDVPKPLKLDEPYGWQLEVLEIIKQEPERRKINWYWEPTGGVGKTALCKYLVVKHNALMVTGKSTDMFHMLAKYANKRELILINVPRSTQDFINYGAIEAIKDGLVCSGKYDGAQLVFNEPHIFVFANEPPNMEKMSLDKWNIVRIEA